MIVIDIYGSYNIDNIDSSSNSENCIIKFRKMRLDDNIARKDIWKFLDFIFKIKVNQSITFNNKTVENISLN